VTPEVAPVPIEADSQADFGDWVASRGASLQRFAYLVSGSAADAPDLVQEALIGALPRWESLAKRGTAEAYVRRSIVNASVSRWRSTRRLVTMADPVGPSADDLSPTVDDADQAWRMLIDLPPNQRAAVVLRFYEDLSFAQIAVILDCTESTARSHVHRAVAALRTRLEEEQS
jgi:RNA polymerase sigma-70 factor (sigma-E family)